MTVAWWLRVVGAMYLFAGVANLVLVIWQPPLLENNLPYPAAPAVMRAFGDAWLVFALGVLALGAMMLYASRTPATARILVQTVLLVELLTGVVADAVWIARGHSALIYIPFITLHLAIIATGVAVLRRDPAGGSGA